MTHTYYENTQEHKLNVYMYNEQEKLERFLTYRIRQWKRQNNL